MARRVLLCGVVALALCAMVVAPSVAEDAKAKGKAEVGKPAPDFTLPDVYGNDFKLSQFKGKVVVIEWINQFCPVSLGKHRNRTMQNLKQYAKEGVVWLAIDSTHKTDADKNRVYAANMALAYPILADPSGRVGKMYGAKTTPHMFVIDKDGKLVYDGAIDDNTDESRVLFVQTQFSPADVHVAVIKLLRHLAKRYFHELTVIDEGDYWRSEDLTRLIEKREQQLREMKKVERAIKDAPISPDDEPEDIASKIEDCFRRLEDEDNLN